MVWQHVVHNTMIPTDTHNTILRIAFIPCTAFMDWYITTSTHLCHFTMQTAYMLNPVTDTTSTSLTFTYDLRGIVVGSVIEVDVEECYVMATDEVAKTATVLRGYGSSSPATHAAGAEVTVNPKFARLQIFNGMNDALDALYGAGLFKITIPELVWNSTRIGYDLVGVTAMRGVYRVSYDDIGSERAWPIVPPRSWSWRPNAETDDFTTGFVLFVEVMTPFTRLTATTQDVHTDAGLPATANRVLKYRTAMGLVAWRETMRNVFETQGDSRRAGEVPAGAQIGAARMWQAVYEEELGAELTNQAAAYPEYESRVA